MTRLAVPAGGVRCGPLLTQLSHRAMRSASGRRTTRTTVTSGMGDRRHQSSDADRPIRFEGERRFEPPRQCPWPSGGPSENLVLPRACRCASHQRGRAEYEIDLSNENAAEMRSGLSRYVDGARKVTGGGRRSAPAAKPTYAGYDPAAVRAWAAGQGIAVNARGRIKADDVEKFRAAGN